MASVIQFPISDRGPYREPPQRKAHRRYPKRAPSSLVPEQRAFALRSAKYGRSLHDVSVEFSVAAIVPIELWLRDIERRLMVVERRAA